VANSRASSLRSGISTPNCNGGGKRKSKFATFLVRGLLKTKELGG
jgi:hypothetical protein